MSNYSKQKAAISKIIKEHKHSNVSQIHKLAKQEVPNLSLATTYRNLDKLEQDQVIQRIQINPHTTVYETHTGPHHHFICQRCQKIEDLKDPQVSACASCLSQKNNFQISHINMNIFGVCEDCQQ